MKVCERCVPYLACPPQARDILMQMMEVFILKFQSIAEFQIPEIFGRW